MIDIIVEAYGKQDFLAHFDQRKGRTLQICMSSVDDPKHKDLFTQVVDEKIEAIKATMNEQEQAERVDTLELDDRDPDLNDSDMEQEDGEDESEDMEDTEQDLTYSESHIVYDGSLERIIMEHEMPGDMTPPDLDDLDESGEMEDTE